MLRALGIPARVVNGYLAHNYNPVTGLYEVRAFDGHAWVEAWIDGAGWVTFEPTPAYPVPQAVRPNQEVLQQLAHYAQQLARQSALEGRPTLAQTAAAALQSLAELWHLALDVFRALS